MAVSPIKLFHKYRGLSDFTIRTLLMTIHELLPLMVGKQRRYKVTDLPSERTVRYYISRGLVDNPLGKRGTTSLFGYRHLLQVLVIKYLQYQYLPLEKIRTVLADRTNRELEELLPGGAAATLPPSSPPGETGASAPGGGPAPLSGQRGGPGTSESAPVPPVTVRGKEQWCRHAVAPGVELHLREDRTFTVGGKELKSWVESLQRVLGTLDGKKERTGGRD
jgi:DNA-binding transcriptional MerR regulator